MSNSLHIPEPPKGYAGYWWNTLSDQEKNLLIATHVCKLVLSCANEVIVARGLPKQVSLPSNNLPNFISGGYAEMEIVKIALHEQGLTVTWRDLAVLDSGCSLEDDLYGFEPAHAQERHVDILLRAAFLVTQEEILDER